MARSNTSQEKFGTLYNDKSAHELGNLQIELNAYKQECERLRDQVSPQRNQREHVRSTSNEFALDASASNVDLA